MLTFISIPFYNVKIGEQFYDFQFFRYTFSSILFVKLYWFRMVNVICSIPREVSLHLFSKPYYNVKTGDYLVPDVTYRMHELREQTWGASHYPDGSLHWSITCIPVKKEIIQINTKRTRTVSQITKIYTFWALLIISLEQVWASIIALMHLLSLYTTTV